MANPFTKFLRQWWQDDQFEDFVERWDALELIMVRVYREKMTPAEARPQFEATWPWLRTHYREWEAALRPFWQQTKAAGEQTRVDPFRLLLEIKSPEAIQGDWRAMQHLPAAREALNQYILSRTDT